jgi:hypothetical protein
VVNDYRDFRGQRADDVIADIEGFGEDPSVEAELGKLPAHGAGGACPECGVEPSVTGGRCWTCRGRSMQEAPA